MAQPVSGILNSHTITASSASSFQRETLCTNPTRKLHFRPQYRSSALRQASRHVVRGQRLVTRMGLKVVETYNADFELQPDAEQALHNLLGSEAFCRQVVQQCQLPESTKVTFTGKLFQPVPWSVNSRKGMPPEFEKFADDPSFTVINIPPNFMFQAKVFKPSRLCAIYQHV